MAKKTQPTIKDLQRQLNQLEENWKRALADYRNLEKRIAQEKKEFVKFATATLLDKLLSIYDNLVAASQHLKDKGLKMIVRQFWAVLQSEGVTEIKAQDQPFDPQTMDCVELVKGPKDRVVEVVLKGYTLNGRVLRPAKVKVGKGEA